MLNEVIIFGGDDDKDDFDLLDKGRIGNVSVEELKKNLSEFTQALSDILSSVEQISGEYDLTSLTVAVGINGKGRVGFLGTGAEIGSSATLTLNFKKEERNKI